MSINNYAVRRTKNNRWIGKPVRVYRLIDHAQAFAASLGAGFGVCLTSLPAWHRPDHGKLPQGHRPLCDGEPVQRGDLMDSGFRRPLPRFAPVAPALIGRPATNSFAVCITNRPLP